MASAAASLNSTVAVGIDLGTSFSAVAVYTASENHKSAKVIMDSKGNSVIPSIVGFTNNATVVGYRAIAQMADNPENTIAAVKLLMGRKFTDPQVTEDAKCWPYTLKNIDNEPRLQVEFRGETRHYRPEQVSAFILLHLKKMACEYLEQPMYATLDAVLTVPVNFGDTQRQAVREACQIANIKCLRIITEPAAAALAYAWNEFQEKGEKDKGDRILVFDMGGGTTDIAIMHLGKDHQYDVLACMGNNHLGGEDLDTLLVNYCIERNSIAEDTKILIHASHSAMVRIRCACERAKRVLSSSPRSMIEVEEIVEGVTFRHEITRTEFEELVGELLTEAVSLIQTCMEDVGLETKDIGKVVLAGGSCRIPKLQEMISEALPGVLLHTSLSQDEAVACGAALQAAKDSGILYLCLTETIPWSLGIALYDGTINRVIEKYTPIPTSNSEVYHTYHDYQTSLIFDVYEGEGTKSTENRFLATMTLNNIRRAPECEVAADTTFEIDCHGILQVTAKEQGRNNEISVKIQRHRAQLSAREVTGLANQAETEHLHGVVHELCEQVTALGLNDMDEEQRLGVESQAVRVREWVASNPNPTAVSFGELVTELQHALEPFGATVSSGGAVTTLPKNNSKE